MAVELTDLANLNADDITQNLKLLTTYLSSLYPSMDMQPGGVLHSLLLRPAAIFHTLNQTNIERYRQSSSLLEITADPTLADADIVDALLSNYKITRSAGSQASGYIALSFSTNDFVAIPTATVFSANGMTFSPIAAVYGVSTTPTSSSSILFTQQTSGVYVINVPVMATTVGDAGNVAKGTRFTIDKELPNLIDATAASDFDGGSNEETNTDLVARLQNGITTPSVGSRNAIKSLIQNNFAFVKDISIIGAGDPEMTRDSHNTLGIKSFGKVDVYVRTRSKPIKVTVTKSAVLQDPVAKTFAMTFTRDEYPGLYDVDSILPSGVVASGSLEITAMTRTTNTAAVTNVDMMPTMTSTEAVFTRYQAISLTFTDTSADVTGLIVGSTVNYSVTLVYMPDIGLINDWLLHRSRRHAAGDYLVKAPIPCFVGVALKIMVGPDDAQPDTGAIKAAVIEAVNGVTFAEGQLDASVVINAAQSLLPRKSKVLTPIDLRGRVIKPDGNDYWLFDPNKLAIETLPGQMVSARTVAFYLDSANIIVETVASDALPV